jgi:NAD(P)H-hydrate epimerase
MQRAGAAAAAEIALRYRDRLGDGVLVLAGPGNNGGDAWVIARALATTGVAVRVIEPVPARTPDAVAERALTVESLGTQVLVETANGLVAGPSVVIDGLLGTGSTGAPRGAIADGVALIRSARENGRTIVALDVPTGIDATTGHAQGAFVTADLTFTFGTVKRGLLVNREACGTIVVLDIGLGSHMGAAVGSPSLVDERWVAEHVPAIPWDAHKGTRRKLAIVGGARGMAGASLLVARAAIRSGVGMVKLIVADESVPVVQEAESLALCAPWPRDDASAERDIKSWADAIVIGPGLGLTDASSELLSRVLSVWTGPTLVDADALTLLSRRSSSIASLLGGRAALLTPHVTEFARLAGIETDAVLSSRFDVGIDWAKQFGATILLKGVPTVVFAPTGERLVSATGTPVLATGGSGDVLSGVAGTLLAQIGDPFVAGAAAAWVHGRAAEHATSGDGGVIRGLALDDVVRQLRGSWTFDTRPSRYPVLAELGLQRLRE